MTNGDANPYLPPSELPDSTCNNEPATTVASWLFILVLTQLTLFSLVDFLAHVLPNWGQIRINGIVASWGVLGLLSRTRMGGVLPVIVVLGALLSQLSTSGEVVLLLFKAVIATCFSAASAYRLGKINSGLVSWNDHVCELVGWCCGAAVFGCQLLTIGSFVSITEALFSYAGIGLVGAGRRRLFVCVGWVVTWYLFRFGFGEAVVEGGVALISFASGRAVGLVLGRRK